MEAEAVRPKPFSLPQILSAVVQPDRMSVMSMPGVASVWSDAVEYWIDAARRTILYWDVMRQRGNHYHEQQKRAALSILSFAFKLIMDGRTLPRPVNYMLVRITPPQGVEIDPKKRPFVIVDPRAGHGPGIGGFKADSEIGVAMRTGHPCYFVGFLPDPMPGRTIEDVAHAEACKMADRGQIRGGLVDGPLALDNAISPEAARIKGIRSEVAGHAQILVAPDLEAGNMPAKKLTFLANADAAGVVLGARVPIILTSRADAVPTRMASCAVAVLYAHARRAGRAFSRE